MHINAIHSSFVNLIFVLPVNYVHPLRVVFLKNGFLEINNIVNNVILLIHSCFSGVHLLYMQILTITNKYTVRDNLFRTVH